MGTNLAQARQLVLLHCGLLSSMRSSWIPTAAGKFDIALVDVEATERA